MVPPPLTYSPLIWTCIGTKNPDYASEFWADHDENCHGPYESFTDDPDFAEGFMWDCCEKRGDGKECMITRHRAKLNLDRVQLSELVNKRIRHA